MLDPNAPVPAWVRHVVAARPGERDEAPPPYLDPGVVAQVGRFAASSVPWWKLGANVLPQVPGEKSPAVSGWGGKSSKNPFGLARSWGLGDRTLHCEDDPKIPQGAMLDWARDFRDHNALIFPATLGAFVVDVDDISLLGRVIEAVGATPYRTTSGRPGGGVHLWYRGVCGSRNKVVPGVDIKSRRGYVIAPGSLHAATGMEYRASDELHEALQAGSLKLPSPHPDWRARLRMVTSGTTDPTRMDLFALSDELAANRRKREISKRLRLVASGESFADEGERDGTMFTLLFELARWWPRATADSIVQLFERSISTWADPAADADKIREKWERATSERVDDLDTANLHSERLRRVAWSWVEIDSAEPAGLGDPIVVHKGRTYYVRVADHWSGPWVREELGPGAIAAIRSLYSIGPNDYTELMIGYSQRLREIRQSLIARETVLDNGVLTVASAPRSRIEPAYSERVDRGLTMMAGQWVHHLRRWIGGLVRQDVPSRALILSGPKGTGKTLLLTGLSRIWKAGAAQMRHVVGRRFNDELLATPFAIADDDTSAAESGEALAAFLRQAVSDRSQKVERKFHDVTTVDGCLRFAVATNDPLELVQGAVSYKLNDASLSAFGDRLLHIPVSADARGWWGSWADELARGEIAAHALWLAGQFEEPEERFWVKSADGSLERLAVLSNGLRGDVLLRLSDLISDEDNDAKRGGVEVVGDVLFVHARTFDASWVIDRPRSLTARSAGLTIKALALASGAVQPAYTGGQRRHAIARSLVDWYASHCGV